MESLGYILSGSGADASEPPPVIVKHLVELFQVGWEALPELSKVGGENRQIGFSLTLRATHKSPGEHTEPDCPHCHTALAALQVIAGWVTPKEVRPSFYAIEAYEPTAENEPASNHCPQVSLALKILHREGFERPVDACEVRCLGEMEPRLRELGAFERQRTSSGNEH